MFYLKWFYRITKEVDADSKEAKDEQKKQEKAKEEEEKQKKTLGASSILSGGPSLGWVSVDRLVH